MFQEDLLAQLRKLGAKGDRIILMMDAKYGVIDWAICKHFGKDGLNIGEAALRL